MLQMRHQWGQPAGCQQSHLLLNDHWTCWLCSWIFDHVTFWMMSWGLLSHLNLFIFLSTPNWTLSIQETPATHSATLRMAAQLACGFSPQHRNNPGRYPNTNRQICWLMQWVAASGWRRRWLSACFDLFQGRTEIHLISFHWLIIREKITVMALIKVRQQVNSSWSTNSRKKLWCTQARCHSALLLFQYSKQ